MLIFSSFMERMIMWFSNPRERNSIGLPERGNVNFGLYLVTGTQIVITIQIFGIM
jgi:hypothetical protein